MQRHSTSPVTQVGLPGPLGMILTGIAVGNINSGHLVKGLPASWSKELRAIALAIIFLRSGLELDLRVGPSHLTALFVLSVLLCIVSSRFICLTVHSVSNAHDAWCAGCSSCFLPVAGNCMLITSALWKLHRHHPPSAVP